MPSLKGAKTFLATKQKQLTDKFVLVVGGTSGIGRGIADTFSLTLGANVSIAGRNQQSGEAFIQASRASNASGDFNFYPVDASSVADSIRLAEQIANSWKRLDYLVISAGLMRLGGRHETAEGLDDKMATHYYARFAFIQAIMPLLEKTAKEHGTDVRVLSVLAATKGFFVDKNDIDLKKNYSLYNCSQAAPFYNDLMVEEFSIRHPNISFCHAFPGVVNTEIGRNLPIYLRAPLNLLNPLLSRSQSDCAAYLIAGFLDDERKSGWHLLNENGDSLKPVKDHTSENRELVAQFTRDLIVQKKETKK